MDVYPSSHPKNFLFRGNMPVVNGSFAYAKIRATMAGLIQDAGFTMPTKFYLIVIR